jgi:hypothetical protein
MKAVAVFPGKVNSMHLTELPKPALDAVPNGRGLENYRQMIDTLTTARDAVKVFVEIAPLDPTERKA